jgi:hypothetical protein
MLDAAIRTQNHAGPLKVVFSDVDPHCSCHIKHWQSMVFPHFSSRSPSTGLEAEIQVEGPCLGLWLTSVKWN